MKEPAQCDTGIIEALRSKIRTLEKENRLLKERLDEAGISYADIMPDNGDEPSDLFDPDALPEGGLGNVIALPL